MAAEIIAAGKNESAAVQKSGLAESFGFAWAQVRQPPRLATEVNSSWPRGPVQPPPSGQGVLLQDDERGRL